MVGLFTFRDVFRAVRVCALSLMVISGGAGAARAQVAPDAAFQAIYEAEWNWRQSLSAESEDSSGGQIPDHLPDVSATAQAERLERFRAARQAVLAIPEDDLSPENRINRAVYLYQVDSLIAELSFREFEKPLNSDSAFWSDLGFMTGREFRTEADYRRYISWLKDFPRYFAQNIANMQAGLDRGFTPPRVTLTGREASVKRMIDAPVTSHPFYAPFDTLPASLPPVIQAQLRAEAQDAITDAVIPSYSALLTFLVRDYIPGAVESLAATDLPDGEAYYESKVREFTTLPMTAQGVHETGLREVAAIRAEMEVVMAEAEFRGDLPKFLKFLRKDRRFYARTPEELLMRAAWAAKRFDGVSEQWFGRRPRKSFGIVPVPDDIAPYYTSGRGGPGTYWVNTYNLPSRPLYSLMALTLHESAPGHAFQMSLAAENEDLPAFRRETYISAYGEGWALYCEKLGVEMGLYDTPYDRFGMLSYQMWRAARLVVDTGVHAYGWSREQARAYLRDNTALSEHEIETEVDRYISWPGQALSYYTGEMAILAARARAEAALGPAFDIRAFHDTVLSLGSVPLPVLEARIDRFIADGGLGPWPVED